MRPISSVVSDFGGNAEIDQYCGSVGGPFCTYPWFTLGHDGSFRYGAHYSDTANDFGKGDQFAQDTLCGGFFVARRAINLARKEQPLDDFGLQRCL